MPLPLSKSFDPEKEFAILSVEKPEIPERIRKIATERNLTEKDESHISVIVTTNARKLRNVILGSQSPEKLQQEIESLFKSLSWEYLLTDNYFLQENFYTRKELDEAGHADLPEHTRRTIIQLVAMPDMKLFHERLSELCKTPFTVPVPHITLFSWSDYNPLMVRGIGISSEKDFKRYLKEKL